MKIGYVLRSLEDSGVTVYCLTLAEAMRDRGHDVFLVSDGGVYGDRVRELNLRHHHLPLCGNTITSYLAARRLADIVSQEQPDILHGNWRRAQLACHLTRKKLGTPFVTTLHLVGISDNWLYRRLTYWGQRVIAPCTEAVDYLRDRFGVPDDRIRLVFHGVDPDKWPVACDDEQRQARAAFDLPTDATVLICVARLEKIKGHDVLLRALARAADSQPSLCLLLVGAGREDAALKQLASTLGVAERVRFLGYVDPHQAMAAADAFVLASHRESFGFAPVEAMLSGRAVVRTDSHGAADQIVPGETGQIVPRGDVAALADCLADVAAHRPSWVEQGRAARQRALSCFTVATMAEKVDGVYAEVANV